MNEQNPLDPLHVNDRVIVVEDTSGCFPHTVGLEGVVVGEEGTHLCTLPWPAVVVGYEVEFPECGFSWLNGYRIAGGVSAPS